MVTGRLRLVHGMAVLVYEEELSRPCLCTFSVRRRRGYLTEPYIIFIELNGAGVAFSCLRCLEPGGHSSK